MKIYDCSNVKRVKVKEDYSKKAKNFQLVRPLTVQQQIERFTSAGRKLEELRNLGMPQHYDFDEDNVDLDLEAPEREPDYDIIDAAVAQRDLALKLQSQQTALLNAQNDNEEQKKDADVEQQATETQKPKETAATDV